jgi:hypothetical protein
MQHKPVQHKNVKTDKHANRNSPIMSISNGSEVRHTSATVTTAETNGKHVKAFQSSLQASRAHASL